MNQSFEYLRSVEPNLRGLAYGGWLARAPDGVAIRIAVEGQSEAEAREKFKTSMARWIENLSIDE